MPTTTTAATIPGPGDVVRLRTRTYLVQKPLPSANGTIVSLACLDDDAQGQELEVIWELELDAEILGEEAWKAIGKRGFDDRRFFSSYLHTLRWHCVTATDPGLFQSPFRAGIRLEAYQLEPLRKALRLPRVNLFIADDVGLGKTIEAGLIASELLLRRRVHDIVVACPPSMLGQWRDELEQRFGLSFEILDRHYVERVRRERGYSVNPWDTYPRFLVSHRFLIDEGYVGPLRDWLDNLRPGSLFIFDEAHHAAPASGGRYAIDSKITRAVRDLAHRFEHRLFLSATPHNGHSNSFSALLEILDNQRFTRGVNVRKADLTPVMIRRLKEDVRQISGGFPKRIVRQVDLKDLPEGTPELRLSQLLDDYREQRQRRLGDLTKRKQAAAALIVSHLQQRLLSSVEAFAKTLAVHRRTMERWWSRELDAAATEPDANQLTLLNEGVGPDTEHAQLPEEQIEALMAHEVEVATAATLAETLSTDIDTERRLLTEMQELADEARDQPDARMRYLIDWVQQHLCQGARMPGEPCPERDAMWTDRRILIFTEYDDTKRYLVDMLKMAIADTDQADRRIEVFHGPTPLDKRDAIKRAFNLPPDQHPIRILVCTDAAREGLNLQAHCHHLFHFDVPWNPSRLEQRNGRIDRKLQPATEVYCHYFVYHQRPEDRVLKALVRKTGTIREELGSLAEVLETRLTKSLRYGIWHQEIDDLERDIESAGLDSTKRAIAEEELEATRERQQDLQSQIDRLRNRINAARQWIQFEPEQFKEVLSCSLEMLGAEPLQTSGDSATGLTQFDFPNLESRKAADPSWSATMDTLRKPPDNGRRDFEWRRDSPLRPVVFEAPPEIDDDVVQLHLGHRVVQRLLGRFLSQGFVYHDLSRACLAQTEDAIPRVVLLGRLSLYGTGAARLHEELLTVTARWSEVDSRPQSLSPYAREAEGKTMDLLEKSLLPKAGQTIPDTVSARLLAAIPTDIEQLLPHLESRGLEAKETAETKLTERGRAESAAMRKVLEEQRKRVERELGRSPDDQLFLSFNDEEKRQLRANRRYWERWLKNVEGDLEHEPQRILDFYHTASHRIEPVGLAYLWPVTG